MITRFAPSPTGFLHLGHAFAAQVASQFAAKNGGKFLLRIEDIDQTRSRPEFESAIYEDLEWLGFSWEPRVLRQSERLETYQLALDNLITNRLAYPCFCTRKEIQKEAQQLASAPHGKPSHHYPGTCRTLTFDESMERLEAGMIPAWRLNTEKALQRVGPLKAIDRKFGDIEVTLGQLDDLVLGRKDIGTSYHLSVVIDDAAQGITLVTRGEDLLSSVPYHRLLQELLQLPVPEWYHHELVKDPQGKRLATRDKAHSIRQYRENGLSPSDVLALMPSSL